MNELLTTNDDVREQAFREYKEDGEQMVHRLRNWEAGDILWGWESIRDGSSTGKTYSRRKAKESKARAEAEDFEHLSPDDAHESAKDAFEACCDPDRTSLGGGPGAAVFLYAARIGSVRTEPHSSHDPEPPLKFATLEKVVVVDSHFENE